MISATTMGMSGPEGCCLSRKPSAARVCSCSAENRLRFSCSTGPTLENINGTAPNNPPVGTGTNNVVDDKYTLDGQGVWGGPGYYVDSNGNPVAFYAGTDGHLNRLTFGAQQQIVQSAQTAGTFSSGNSNGFTVNVSSDAAAPGTAIVWLVDRNNLPADPNVRLFAYDADTLTQQLVEVPAGSWTTKGTFTDPTVIDGRVFVGSDGQVTVLGLNPALGPA